MKLIAQKNNWILQNVVIMKINNCLTRANNFSTHHQSSSNVILLWQNKCRINWSLDLPFNWFILSPKELILTAITRTVNHNDVSKNFLRRFIFFLYQIVRLFLKYIHRLFVFVVIFIFYMTSSWLISYYFSNLSILMMLSQLLFILIWYVRLSFVLFLCVKVFFCIGGCFCQCW